MRIYIKRLKEKGKAIDHLNDAQLALAWDEAAKQKVVGVLELLITEYNQEQERLYAILRTNGKEVLREEKHGLGLIGIMYEYEGLYFAVKIDSKDNHVIDIWQHVEM